MEKKTNRLLELDALRGIAAVMVMLFHYTMAHSELCSNGFNLGVTSIDLFFIISGFVILMTLEKTSKLKDFCISRFARLFPAYWFCASLTALLSIYYYYATKRDFIDLFYRYLANLTMFHKYFNMDSLDASYWTLLVEMLFYIFMALIFVVRKLKYLEYIGVAIVSIVLLYGLVYPQIPIEDVGNIDKYFPLIKHFPLFFAGIYFYGIKYKKPTILRYVLIVYCFGIQLSLYDISYSIRAQMPFLEYVSILAVYFIIFYLFIIDRLSFIVNPVTLFLGKISYPLYLFHQYLGISFVIPILNRRLSLSFGLSVLISIIIAIFSAYLISRFVEIPAMEHIKSKYKKRNL